MIKPKIKNDFNAIVERDFQKDVCYWLRNNDYKFIRGNKGRQDFWVADSKGMPDLIILNHSGEFVGVELKREKGILSTEQQQMQKSTRNYFVLRPSQFYDTPNDIGKNYRFKHDYFNELFNFIEYEGRRFLN